MKTSEQCELLLRHTLCARHTSRCELIALRGVLAPHTGQVAKEERSAARCCAATRGGDGAAAARSGPVVGVTKPEGPVVGVTKPEVTKPEGAALRTNCRSEGWPGSARLRFAAALVVAEPDTPPSAYTSTSASGLAAGAVQ